MAGRGKPIKEAKLTPVYIAQAWHEDEDGGALNVIQSVHHHAHDGIVWYLDLFTGSLPNNGTVILAGLMAPGYAYHFSFAGACGGDASIELIEGCTFSSSGTARTPFNMNRVIGDAGALAVRENPTVSGGTSLERMLLPGGTGPQAGGGQQGTRAGLEWIAAPSTAYAVILKNLSGQAQPAWIGVNFYTVEI